MNRSHTPSVASLTAYEPLPEQRNHSTGSYRWFAVLWIIALLTASLHENLRVNKRSNEPNYNFLLFSQESSPGYCAGENHCTADHIRPFWTVHGLWPSNDTTWPQFCNKTVKFNVTLLEPIMDDMKMFWPSAISEDNNHFWSHEWEKHGTCAMNVPALKGVFNYFNSTLHLLRSYNVSNFLLDDNVVPSNTETYTVKEILKALENDLSTRANIACRRVTGFAYPVLSEVRFCLSKTTLAPMDCKMKHENCGTGKIFYLPPPPSGGQNLDVVSALMLRVFKVYLNYMSPI